MTKTHTNGPKDHNIFGGFDGRADDGAPPRRRPRPDTRPTDPNPAPPTSASPSRGCAPPSSSGGDPIAWSAPGSSPGDRVHHKRHPGASDANRNVINWSAAAPEDEEPPHPRIRLASDPMARKDHDVLNSWASDASAHPAPKQQNAPKNEDHDPVKWRKSPAPSPHRTPVAGRRKDTDFMSWDKNPVPQGAASDAAGEAAGAPANPDGDARQQAIGFIRDFTGGEISKKAFFGSLEAIPGFQITQDLQILANKVDNGSKVPFRQFVGALKVVPVSAPDIKVTPRKASEGSGDIVGWTTEPAIQPRPVDVDRDANKDPIAWDEEKHIRSPEEIDSRHASESAISAARGLNDSVVLASEPQADEVANREQEHKHAAEVHKTSVHQLGSNVGMNWDQVENERASHPQAQPSAKFALREAERNRGLNLFSEGQGDNNNNNNNNNNQQAAAKEGRFHANPSQPDSMGGLMNWGGDNKEQEIAPAKTPERRTKPLSHEEQQLLEQQKAIHEEEHNLTRSMTESARHRDRYGESPIGWRPTSATGSRTPVRQPDFESLRHASGAPPSPSKPVKVPQHYVSNVVFGDDSSPQRAPQQQHYGRHHQPPASNVFAQDNPADAGQRVSARRRPESAQSANQESREKPKEARSKILPHHKSSIIF